MGFKKVSDEIITESYLRLGNVWKVAKEIGLCGQSVHERVVKLGILNIPNYWSDEDINTLKSEYNQYAAKGRLQELADKLRRGKTDICTQAKKHGLTSLFRKKSDFDSYVPIIRVWKIHPKGMLGKKHTDEVKNIISAKSIEYHNKVRNSSVARERILKQHKTKFDRYGSNSPRVTKGSWKAGWRIVGGDELFFRSKWEANYARYLQALMENGVLLNWEHEANIFGFDNEDSGSVTFIPDFKVTLLNNEVEYHEVKGWYDERSLQNIDRMSKHYPCEKLIIVDKIWYNANRKKLSKEISGWEI